MARDRRTKTVEEKADNKTTYDAKMTFFWC